MIKRYNENWGPIKGGSRKGHFSIIINAVDGDPVEHSIERALRLSKKESANIILNIDGLELEISPENTMEDILDNYHKCIKYQENSNDYWRDYWEQKSSDPEVEMDTIDDYAMKHSISRGDAEKFFKAKLQSKSRPVDSGAKKNNVPKFQKGDNVYDYTFRMYGEVVDYNPNKEESYLIEFTDGTSVWLEGDGMNKVNKTNHQTNNDLIPVVGLPSGEIIYMTYQQIIYFKVRNQVVYKKIYRKTVGEHIENVNLEHYTYKDSEYDNITFIITIQTWK